MPELQRSIGMLPAAGIVVANMIGAGIFTTTGFQAAAIANPLHIYALWVVGGVLALCGAVCYAELGAAIPRAGAEYQYLREAFGGSFALMSALTSLTAGFSAPIASALKSCAFYLAHLIPWLEPQRAVIGSISAADLFAIAAVWALVALHCRGLTLGIRVTSAITAFKIGGIVVFLIAAVAIGKGELANLTRHAAQAEPHGGAAQLGALATSLIFVMFCYSGWNSAAYLAGEMRDPARDLPRALLLGTLLVVVLYLGLNFAYFYGAGAGALAGQVEVGVVAAEHLFGPGGATCTTVILSLSLLAAASAMTAIGPRVYYAVGREYPALQALAGVRSDTGAPATALIVQGVTTSLFILLGRVDQIQQYAGFTLSVFAALSVASVIVLRVRRPELPRPFRAWGYPFTPLLFLAISIWTIFWAFSARPLESSLGITTIAAGGALHFALKPRSQPIKVRTTA